MAEDGVKPAWSNTNRDLWRREDLEAWLDNMAGNPLSEEINPWYR
jgi:hypothetical protein